MGLDYPSPAGAFSGGVMCEDTDKTIFCGLCENYEDWDGETLEHTGYCEFYYQLIRGFTPTISCKEDGYQHAS